MTPPPLSNQKRRIASARGSAEGACGLVEEEMRLNAVQVASDPELEETSMVVAVVVVVVELQLCPSNSSLTSSEDGCMDLA